MIHESTTIALTCDRKGCVNMDRVNAADESDANLILYKLGWRSAHRRGKDIPLCPAHAALEQRRLEKQS